MPFPQEEGGNVLGRGGKRSGRRHAECQQRFPLGGRTEGGFYCLLCNSALNVFSPHECTLLVPIFKKLFLQKTNIA